MFDPPQNLICKMCQLMPPLRTIAFQKLIQIESRCRRQPIEEVDMSWNPDTVPDTEDIFVTVQTPVWNPRRPIKSKQNWDPPTRRLLHVCVKDFLQ